MKIQNQKFQTIETYQLLIENIYILKTIEKIKR